MARPEGPVPEFSLGDGDGRPTLVWEDPLLERLKAGLGHVLLEPLPEEKPSSSTTTSSSAKSKPI